MNWLAGRRVLAVGTSPALTAVAAALAVAGALVTHGAGSSDAGEIAAEFSDAEFEILVHGGASIGRSAPETLTIEAWREGLSADIDGRFLFMAEFARQRIAAEAAGAILLLMPSATRGPGRAAALSAHGALDNLVKTVAVEWGRDGIRTNAIASRVVEDFDRAGTAAQASLGHLAAYLVSDYAAYATGMTIGIDEEGAT